MQCNSKWSDRKSSEARAQVFRMIFSRFTLLLLLTMTSFLTTLYLTSTYVLKSNCVKEKLWKYIASPIQVTVRQWSLTTIAVLLQNSFLIEDHFGHILGHSHNHCIFVAVTTVLRSLRTEGIFEYFAMNWLVISASVLISREISTNDTPIDD